MTMTNIKELQKRIIIGKSQGLDLYDLNDNGFLISEDFIESDQNDRSGYRDYFNYRSHLKRMPVKPINAVILHSTAGSNIGGALNTGRGALIPGTHFYVNKQGKIFQAVSLLERTSHINNNTNRTSRLDVSTSSSIGIENVRMWYQNRGWDVVTEEQIKTNIKLVNTLLVMYNLKSNDVLAHENIQHKTKGEGSEIIDKILHKLI